MSAAVQSAVDFGGDRRFSVSAFLHAQPSFEALLDPGHILDSLHAFVGEHQRGPSAHGPAEGRAAYATAAEELDAMFDSMFSGPGSPGAGAGTGSVTSDFESEFADLDSLMSGQDSMSIATGEALDFLVAADPMIKEEPRIIKAATAPLFPPLAASSFGSMVIPSNDAAPAADAGLFAAAAPAVPAPKPAGKKPAQARRPRSSSTPLQYVAPSVVAPKSVHARGSSTSLADRARPVPGSPAAVQIVQADPAGPLDYLDAMLRTRLGPDPALLEDASLDAMEDAMYEEEGEEGDKKGKKRRRRTTAELSTSELETRRLKNSEAARRCRLRKTLRVKWLEARVRELEEVNAVLVGKLKGSA